eukprot:CAMPEP_0194394700 /NCGR_PEP_ID=MMETSP0174-20130528/124002_1 /TAXON_ID=216777 /ORGANISM="Proboscia alata, Strain PI-D3" /LENGTH=240 /DNA_ID=CAMNT_0039190531 /DNA_START=207 /DNA_END=929 /DNA_ORIENTATION=-
MPVYISLPKNLPNSKTPPTRTTNHHLQLSPSGIDTLPEIVQASVFVGSYGILGASTIVGVQTLDVASATLGLERWRKSFVEGYVPLLLGSLYGLAGVSHFGNAEAFTAIYPPVGTWGLWYLPGTAGFHVAWTGLVELFGGMGLLWGFGSRLLLDEEEDDDGLVGKLIQPLSALLLFVLTVAVTPANIYMFTHGATMGGADAGPLPLSFHFVRFGVQVVLLSLLLALAKDSLFFAWGDELD